MNKEHGGNMKTNTIGQVNFGAKFSSDIVTKRALEQFRGIWKNAGLPVDTFDGKLAQVHKLFSKDALITFIIASAERKTPSPKGYSNYIVNVYDGAYGQKGLLPESWCVENVKPQTLLSRLMGAFKRVSRQIKTKDFC